MAWEPLQDFRKFAVDQPSRRPADEDSPPARLIGGGRLGPLEDSRGFPGYEEIMDAEADPSHPDHAERSAWVADITGSDVFLTLPSRTSPP